MNIAICWQYPTNETLTAKDIFIVQTFSGLAGLAKDHNFILLVNKNRSPHNWVKSKFKILDLKFGLGNKGLQKLISSIRLSRLVKEKNIGLIISIDDSYYDNLGIPSFLFLTSYDDIGLRKITGTKRIAVTGQQIKKTLVIANEKIADKITVISPFSSNIPDINSAEKDSIKRKFSDGKEYFLFAGSLPDSQSFIDLLKAFSYFKKRQQSEFKFLFLLDMEPEMQKELSSFKYREDVKIVTLREIDLYFHLIASAYAIILPFNLPGDIFSALNAMKLRVPVLATKNSEIDIIAGSNALIAETVEGVQISEKMMQIYINENYRSELIKKGETFVKDFDIDKTLNQLQNILYETLP